MTTVTTSSLDQAQEALEFKSVLALLQRHIASPLGETQLKQLSARRCLSSSQEAVTEFKRVGEAIGWLREFERSGGRSVSAAPKFNEIEDISEPVRRLAMADAVLDVEEIQSVIVLLGVAGGVHDTLLREKDRSPQLSVFLERLADFKPQVRELSGKILPDGEISSLASSTLSKIRRKIEKQRQVVEESLSKFLRKYSDKGVLQDSYITMRNGRMVVPVKANWKHRVEGIVHKTSSTGQTAFVEPLDTIRQNNYMVRLHEEEQGEILRILREMSNLLRGQRAAISEAVDVLGQLEYILARARFALEFRCCLPGIKEGDDARIFLEEARHPLLEDQLASTRKRPVPMSLCLEKDKRTMVVSGPNAGGKTVVLKTVGLLAMMAHAGIPIPADTAEFPWLDNILVDIGDAQSISESLSTFSAHVSNLASILEIATPKSLIVLDELSTATDPEDGGALAVAVVERLKELGAFILVSTHLPELKMFSLRAEGVQSASLEFDEKSLGVTYQLLVGMPGNSVGLEMARHFGMPSEIVQRAQSLKGTMDEHVTQYLSDLRQRASEYEASRSEVRIKQRQLELQEKELAEKAQRQECDLRMEMEKRIEDMARKLQQQFQKQLDKALKDIASAGSKAVRIAERRVSRSLTEHRRVMSEEVHAVLGASGGHLMEGITEKFEVGDNVRLRSMGMTGTLVRMLDASQWEVQVGSMRLQVEGEDITRLAEEPERPPRLPEGVHLEIAQPIGGLPSEINVIGKTADEALQDVDKFLDRAVLAGKVRLRVIHGFGQDILRRELWRMFARHIHVSKYYQAEQHEGGAGATIVEVGSV